MGLVCGGRRGSGEGWGGVERRKGGGARRGGRELGEKGGDRSLGRKGGEESGTHTEDDATVPEDKDGEGDEEG